MSGNPGQQPLPADPTPGDADRIVREILDNQLSVTDISPSGELLRAINRFNRSRSHTTESSAATGRPPLNNDRMNNDRIERRRRVRAAVSRAAAANPPTALQSAQNLLQGLQTANIEMLQASQQLHGVTNDLEQLIRAPIHPNIEMEVFRASKRRKLDASISTEITSRPYGHYGQVEPGVLNMEIDFCDGGMFSEGGNSNYSAGNVLKNDMSVYCTKGNRCNLVLRHQGATAFSMKELIIKAPPIGYTAPVREGMVFVSMTSDDLLTRTAQYQIQYPPSRSSRRNVLQATSRAPVISIRHNPDGTVTAAQDSTRQINLNADILDEDDYRPAQIPSEFTNTIAATPFHVTATCSDDESEEEGRNTRRRRAPDPIGSSHFDESSSDTNSESEGDDDPSHPWHADYLSGDLVPPLASQTHRSSRRTGPTRISVGLSDALEAAEEATQEAFKAVGGNLMAPHARFFIERDKSKCTVRFDPPVSGRFILLKMWSPQHTPEGNIDIQSVEVKGFAGTRYFPSVVLR